MAKKTFPLIKFLLVSLCFTLFIGLGKDGGSIALAQESNSPELEKLASENETVSFSVSDFNIEPKEEMVYFWSFGDGGTDSGVEITHQYDRKGKYTAALSFLNEQGENEYYYVSVFVFSEVVFLVSDGSKNEEEINELISYASSKDILLVNIHDDASGPDYIVEGSLSQKLLEKSFNLEKAKFIICDTKGTIGLNSLSRLAQGIEPDTFKSLGLSKKVIININGASIGAISRIAQSTFDILKPELIILTQKEVVKELIVAQDTEDLLDIVKKANIEQRVNYKIVGVHSGRIIKKLSLTNFMSYGVNYMINKGVPINTITLLLILPVVATIISFLRQVIGVKTFGIYIPTIITLSFLSTGLKHGLFVFLVVLIAGSFARIFIRKLRLLYLPRMAIVLTLVSLTILAMLTYGAYSRRTALISMSIFPMLIMIILVERFAAVQIEKGFFSAVTLSAETLAVSIFCYYIMNWQFLRTFILAYPEIVFFLIIFNVIIGRWTGLRFSEYFRFGRMVRRRKA